MGNLSKLMMWLSFVFVIICLGASLWMAFVLKDTMSYMMAGIFFIAIIWTALNLRSLKKK